MKGFFNDSLHKWLTVLLFGLCVLSMFLWLTNAPLHMGAVIFALCVWTLLLTGADRLWGWRGAITWCFLAITAALVLADDTQLTEYAAGLLTIAGPELSVGGDILLLCGLAVISTAALYVLNYFWSRAVLSIGWVVFWIVAAIMELKVPRLAIAAMTPILLFTLVQGLQRLRKGGEGAHFAQLSSGLMALFLAASLLLMIMPVSQKPYDYPLLSAIWERIEKVYRDIETRMLFREEGSEQFGINFWGYSDDAQTGDGVENEGRDVLYIRPRRTTNGRLYLTGNTWDSFNGFCWQSTIDPAAGDLLDWNMDSAERIYALWRYKEQGGRLEIDGILRENNAYIFYQTVNTRTLFTAPNTLRITTEESRFPWQAQAGRTTFDYLQKTDTYYRVYYLEENPAYINELIDFAAGYEYDITGSLSWNSVHFDLMQSFVLDMDTIVLVEQQLAKRAQLIEATYLTLPEDLSPKIVALAQEITKDCTSQREKLQAICKYLQTNYSYTTSPQMPPPGKSMLEHMLFDSKEGYCTWYATAATILARCVDIPARYVQGYCSQLNGYTYNMIDWQDSHAWCEAYIRGYGWVTVEATPGYDMAGADWTLQTGTDSPDGSGVIHEEPEEEPQEPGGLTPENTPQPEQQSEAEPIIVRFVMIAACGIAMVVLLVAAMRYEKQKRRYDSADYSGKAVIDLENMLKILARRGYKRRPNESLRKYFGRIKWSVGIDARQVEQIAVLYEEIIFGDRQLTQDEWDECRRFALALKRTKWKY